MKKLLKFCTGIILWLFGMAFIYLALRRLVDGWDFFVWLGHLGQGLAMVLVGTVLIPGTDVQESLKRTFGVKL